MTYMLDTNICIFLMKSSLNVVEAYRNHYKYGICISSIVASELYYGISNSAKHTENEQILTDFLLGFELYDYYIQAAEVYGQIRADLRKKGTPIGDRDLFIAAHAKSAGLTLVTNNTREFGRVEGLLVEDWTAPAY